MKGSNFYIGSVGILLFAAAFAGTGAIAQKPKLPFGPAERDRLLTMCELGRQAQDRGKADDAKKIARMMMEATPFEDAAMYQCQTYMVDYLRNPKNPTHVRIKRLADQAQVQTKK